MPQYRTFKGTFSVQYKDNSMFDNAAAPATSNTDNVLYNIGTLFRPLVDGEITSFIFYKGVNNPDTTHTCKLWDATSRQVLQTLSMTSQAGFVGWVTRALTTPISIVANQQYVIALESQWYVSTANALTGGTYTRDKLNAITGVYASSPAYPNLSFQSSNYYVDIVFRYKV